MKIIKANKIFTVFRGLILLALGLFQVVVGLIGMNSKGTSDGSAAQQFAGTFVLLFSALGVNKQRLPRRRRNSQHSCRSDRNNCAVFGRK